MDIMLILEIIVLLGAIFLGVKLGVVWLLVMLGGLEL